MFLGHPFFRFSVCVIFHTLPAFLHSLRTCCFVTLFVSPTTQSCFTKARWLSSKRFIHNSRFSFFVLLDVLVISWFECLPALLLFADFVFLTEFYFFFFLIPSFQIPNSVSASLFILPTRLPKIKNVLVSTLQFINISSYVALITKTFKLFLTTSVVLFTLTVVCRLIGDLGLMCGCVDVLRYHVVPNGR